MNKFIDYLDSMKRYEIQNLFLYCILFMVIDHIGHHFYPDQLVFRAIGRVGLFLWPVMFYLGILKTSNRERYIKSLFLICCLTQISWVFLYSYPLNDLFFSFFSVLLIWFYENMDDYSYVENLTFSFIFILILSYTLLFQASCVVFFLLPICLYYRLNKSFVFILAVYIFSDPLQIIALLGFPFLFVMPVFRISIPKVFKYAIYPLHYALILFVLVVF